MRGAVCILWHSFVPLFSPKEKNSFWHKLERTFLTWCINRSTSHESKIHEQVILSESIWLFLLLCKNFGLIRKQRVFQPIHRLKEWKCWGGFRGGLKIVRRIMRKYLEGSYMMDGSRLFTKVCSNRTRGNGFKLKEDKFQLNTRNNYFIVSVVRHGNREVLDIPSLEIFKTKLDGALSSLI